MKKSLMSTVIIGTCFSLTYCTKSEPSKDQGLTRLNLATLPDVTSPNANPSTPEKEALGKLLFWDPILSGEKDIACASCHHPNYGYADGIDLSIGVGGMGLADGRVAEMGDRIPIVGRNSPSIVNTAYNGLTFGQQYYFAEKAPMFWDSRASGLETQALGPLLSYEEMRGEAFAAEVALDSIVNRLRAIPQYVNLFSNAFGGGTNAITADNIANAISAFERTIISRNSLYDQYVTGNLGALNDVQKEGMELFFGKANCVDCHSGPMFSDYQGHNIGIQDNDKRDDTDSGIDGTYRFRTPTLRNITLTAPYMHSGTFNDLEGLIQYYNEAESANPLAHEMSELITPLALTTSEVQAVVSFLEALTDESYDKTIPSAVPSQLPVGGNI